MVNRVSGNALVALVGLQLRYVTFLGWARTPWPWYTTHLLSYRDQDQARSNCSFHLQMSLCSPKLCLATGLVMAKLQAQELYVTRILYWEEYWLFTLFRRVLNCVSNWCSYFLVPPQIIKSLDGISPCICLQY